MTVFGPRALALAFCAAIALAAYASTAGAVPATEAVRVPVPKPEEDAKFYAFLKGFRAEAREAGIRAATYDAAVDGITLNERVRELNEKQPEFVKPIWEYLEIAASDDRIAKGREVLAAYRNFFDGLEAKYGVPREIVAAIWGLESNYGRIMGGFNLFEALATLAYDGPRKGYGRRELLAALRIAEREKIAPSDMTGSWAGAFGHTQFVPSTFLAYAVDGDGDGKRDLWRSMADALASTASYLAEHDWTKGESWGEEVTLPAGFPYEEADPEFFRTMDSWRALGVTTAAGEPVGRGERRAALFLPAGHRGPAFLVFGNFGVIMRYNYASAYALGIGHLADRLRGGPPIAGAWPREETPLARDERIAFQEHLARLGFDPGPADGILGKRTRGALRAYQKDRALPADGFATRSLLERMAGETAPGG